MARAGVSYHDVAKAATQLNQNGTAPTVDGVRSVLGTGSKSTIAPLLKQWKMSQAGAVEAAQTGLPSELVTVVKGLYEGMQQQADERIETVQAEAKQAIDAAKLETVTMQQDLAQLQVQLEKQQASLEMLEKENKALQTSLHQEQQAHVEAKTQQTALQQRLEDRDHEIRRLTAQVEQAQHNLEHYREATQQQRDQERADFDQKLLAGEQALRQVSQENQSLHNELKKVEQALAKAETVRDQFQEANQVLAEQNDQRTQALHQVQQRLSELENRYNMTEQSNQALEKKNQALEEKLIAQEKLAAVSQETVTRLTNSNDKAEGRIEALRDDISILKQEKAMLEGQLKQIQRSI